MVGVKEQLVGLVGRGRGTHPARAPQSQAKQPIVSRQVVSWNSEAVCKSGAAAKKCGKESQKTKKGTVSFGKMWGMAEMKNEDEMNE